MADIHNRKGNTLSLQASRAFVVTPSDSTVLSLTDGSIMENGYVLYIGGTGNVAVVTLGGDSVTFVGVPAGAFLPVLVTKVMSTNTTATSILALT
jgi:hypothetical protein